MRTKFLVIRGISGMLLLQAVALRVNLAEAVEPGLVGGYSLTVAKHRGEIP
jgi:hypothetical protein